MFYAIRSRTDRDSEEGFTLIELMIVVLIIGILLAIAIPTFLGARDRANNRSVQSNLRNALTAEKTLFTDNQLYTDTSTTANISTLAAIEPALNWVATSSTVVGAVSAFTPASTTGQVILATKSATGECWYIGDDGLPPTGSVGGTFFASSTSCTAPTTLPSGAPVAGSQSTGVGTVWASAFGV